VLPFKRALFCCSWHRCLNCESCHRESWFQTIAFEVAILGKKEVILNGCSSPRGHNSHQRRRTEVVRLKPDCSLHSDIALELMEGGRNLLLTLLNGSKGNCPSSLPKILGLVQGPVHFRNCWRAKRISFRQRPL
jgi:hypothetical protein